MKLRNKKTGKVQTCDMVVITDEKIDGEIASLNKHTFIFRSIEQFNDEYEAYKSVEPLIKDEKIRKAVRAWAEANDVEEADYWNSDYRFQDVQGGSSISFESNPIETKNRYGNDVYTIAELCGEGEG